VPRLSQETLAEMVGTTRSRVSFFMNRFRKLGFINYDLGDHMRVNSSLLNVVLHDDDGTPLSGGDSDPEAGTGKHSRPPVKTGKPLDEDRAKRPPLPSMERRRNRSAS